MARTAYKKAKKDYDPNSDWAKFSNGGDLPQPKPMKPANIPNRAEVLIEVGATDELVPTSEFIHGEYPFEHFNPVQSGIFPHIGEDINAIIASTTSSGKTVSAELFITETIRTQGKKALYIGPLKALVQEKLDDWSDPSHHFSDLKIAICTGDYKISDARTRELNEADVIVMTPEMLSARCRNVQSEKSTFLQEIGVVVLDESHLIGMEGRGSHTEVAMMKLSQINQDMKIVFLSATMPNVDQVGAWLHFLNGKKSLVISSEYRPCKLNLHFVPYLGKGSYRQKEESKIDTAISLVRKYSDDKFLLFVHGKKTGYELLENLKHHGIEAEFHNADQVLDKRLEIENRFKNDPTLRVIVATSTLAWGCNLPARRVVILGYHRGMSPVDVADIQQMVGRAGRPKYDTQGDAYILCPAGSERNVENWVLGKAPIQSKMLDGEMNYRTLAFHVVNEIYYGNITRKEDFYRWFENSFANFHGDKIEPEAIDTVIENLEKWRAIQRAGSHNENYIATAIGKTASMFYFCPFDTSRLYTNFYKVFTKYPKGEQIPDIEIATALAFTESSNYKCYLSDTDREVLSPYMDLFYRHFQGEIEPKEGTIKNGYIYFSQLQGMSHPYFAAATISLMQDVERHIEVVKTLDKLNGKWDRGQFLDILRLRFKYGVEEKYVNLCLIPGIGSARAQKLYESGVTSVHDFCETNPEMLMKVLGYKNKDTMSKIIAGASELHNKMQAGLYQY
jgi:replicative superfamily II helicase